MFNRLSTTFFSLVVISATLAAAAPSQHLATRQVGDLQCNIDRVKVAGSIFQALNTTRALTVQLANDPASTALISTINEGLIEVSDAVADITTAIFTGQKAPPSARDQVGEGLTLAFDAASNITSTDQAVSDNVTKLKDELLEASFAGDSVVDECH